MILASRIVTRQSRVDSPALRTVRHDLRADGAGVYGPKEEIKRGALSPLSSLRASASERGNPQSELKHKPLQQSILI
jgi:hypothetical protein